MSVHVRMWAAMVGNRGRERCGLVILGLASIATVTAFCTRDPPVRTNSVRLVDFGASTNSSNNVAAFIAAVKSLSEAGGGSLIVDSGTWLTAPFNLTSHMTLVLKSGATLLGTPNISLHPVLSPLPTYGQGRDYGDGHYTSLLHGDGLRDVAIVGEGVGSVVDGNGEVWWRASGAHGHARTLRFTRGHLIEFINTTGIHLSSLRLQNSPFWTVHPYYSDDIYACDLTIRNPPHSPNTDGFDPDSASNVLLEHSTFSVGDDCVAIKSGWDCFGYDPSISKPSVNITIRHLRCSSPTSAGICIGSEMSGGVYNVVVTNFTGNNVSTGLRIKTAQSRGGFVRNITMKDVSLDGVAIAVQVNAFYGGPNPSCGPTPTRGYHLPIVDSILLQNWTGLNAEQAGDLEGLMQHQKSTNLAFRDFAMDCTRPADEAWNCSYVQGTVEGKVLPPPCNDLTRI